MKKILSLFSFILISPFILFAGMISGGIDFIAYYYEDFVNGRSRNG